MEKAEDGNVESRRFYSTEVDARVLYLTRKRVCCLLRYKKKKKKSFPKFKLRFKRKFKRRIGLRYLRLFKTRLFSVAKPLALHFLRYSTQSIKRCRDYRIYETKNLILFRKLNSLFMNIYISRWEVDARYVTGVMTDKVNTERFTTFTQSSRYSLISSRVLREPVVEVNYTFNRLAVLKYYLHRRYRSFSIKKPVNIFLPNVGMQFNANPLKPRRRFRFKVFKYY